MPHDTAGSGDVLVSPRYLAGTTSTEPVTTLLDAAPGWTCAFVGPDSCYASPGQRLRAVRRDSEWAFTYTADPLGLQVWSAHFDRTTPDETLLAFTERLVDGVDNYFADYLHGGQLHTGQTPTRVFAEHEWEPVPGSRPWRMVAPDEHAAFHIRSGHVDEQRELQERSAATWRITAGPDPVQRPSWTAHFTGHTPEPLMTAVALAVTDPQPVLRPAHRVPERHRPLVDLHPAAHSARAAAAQARGHFSAAAQPTPECPQPPASAPAPPRAVRKC